MVLQLAARLVSGRDMLDRDIRDIYLAFGLEGAVLYVGTGENGGVSVYSTTPGSAAQLTDEVYFYGLPTRITETRLGTVSIDDAEVLVVGSSSAGSLVYFALGPDATLGAPEAAEMADANLVAWVAEGPGASRVYAIDSNTETAGVYAVGHGGLRSAAQATNTLPEGSLMAIVDASGGAVMVAVTGGALPEVVSYRAFFDDGVLEVADSAGPAEGLGLSMPTAIESLTAYGEIWAIVGASGTHSLSVLRVSTDGQLMPADHVLDTLNTRFGNVQAVAVVQAAGQVFVFSGGGDDGLTVFSLLPNGRLVHRQSLADAQGLGLNDVTAIEAGVVGDEIQVFVASESMSGLSQFSWSIKELGQVQVGAVGAVHGTGGDDILMAPETGAATVSGQAGDDILVAGKGGGLLLGGAGADIFVLAATDAPQQIADFEPGVDRVDLSLLPWLRSPAQLTVASVTGGIELGFQAFHVVINSASGEVLELRDIWPTGRFASPDRLLTDIIPVPKTLIGTDAAELLQGGDGRDTLYAGGGDDTLSGAAGADSLSGGTGHDKIWTGSGDDVVYGDWGHDTVGGAAGDDWICGDGGWDEIWGGPGNDTLYGGSGHDTIGAAVGNDLLDGGKGQDKVWAGDGDDSVYGGDGNDDLTGGKGHDQLEAGAGNDTVYAADGHDTVHGGSGDDELWGGLGSDWIIGEDGNDTLRGGVDADTLQGGPGNDMLHGLAGADVFVFEAGHGQDHIFDFEPGLDRLEITGGIGFVDLTVSAVDGGTEILSDLGTIMLDRILPDQLGADDFLFW